MQDGLLKGFIQEIQASGLHVKGIRVLQEGELAGEYHWEQEQPRNLYSVSKSIASLGIGIAIGEGLLTLESRVADAFEQRLPQDAGQDARLCALTLRHLLTMSSGHAKEVNPRQAADAVRYFLNIPLAYTPGTHFVYNNGASFLAAAMLQQAAGQTLVDYLMPRLFEPLGIQRPRWDQTPMNITHGFSDLYLSISDMAKIGQLCLQNGRWDGIQVIPSQYLEKAASCQIYTTSELADYAAGYGYQFWMCSEPGVYRADGKNGQFILVAPQKQATVAIQSDEIHSHHILGVVWDELYPLL